MNQGVFDLSNYYAYIYHLIFAEKIKLKNYFK